VLLLLVITVWKPSRKPGRLMLCPISVAFDVFNTEISPELAGMLVESARNIEVVYAPSYTPEALNILSSRKVLRVIRMGAPLSEAAVDNGLEFKRVAGGLLVQKRFDSRIVSPEFIDVVSVKNLRTISLTQLCCAGQ